MMPERISLIIKKIVCSFVFLVATTYCFAQHFVTIKNSSFYIGNKTYNYCGTNFWQGMNLGIEGKNGNRARLIRELDALQKLGINNLRIIGITEGPDTEPFRIAPSNNNQAILSEQVLQGLDFLLAEMKKRNMYAVICLGNFWPWSGGFAQYLVWAKEIASISYPMDTTHNGDWDAYQKATANFYTSKPAIELFKKAIKQIIERVNTINKKAYKDETCIMAWQLCNEPRGINQVEAYLNWIESTAAWIKSLDSNHLVCVGSEGHTSNVGYSGTDFMLTHQSKYIDYTTAHLWVQNWNIYNPKQHQQTYKKALQFAKQYITSHAAMAKKLQKPFVLEEFGIMKDSGSFDWNSTSFIRDNYYAFIFKTVHRLAKKQQASGVNFWAWSGEGRPAKIASWWHAGDDLTGDPPHEPQGWYSVYNTDSSTLKVLKKYTSLFNKLNH